MLSIWGLHPVLPSPSKAKRLGFPQPGRAVLALQVMEGKLDSLYLCVHQQSC